MSLLGRYAESRDRDCIRRVRRSTWRLVQGYREPFTVSPHRCTPRGLQPRARVRRSPRTPVLVSPGTPIRQPAPSGGPTLLCALAP